jgi:hypothetical protein
MEDTCNCPILEDCTVYVNNINHNEMVGLSYRNLYCLQVNKKYKICKRYLAYQRFGKPAPREILPNSNIKLEEITDN